MRRHKFFYTTSAIALLSLSSHSAAYADTLTIATYGGEWGDAIRDCFTTPFTKATGHNVVPEPGVAGVTLAKLRQQAGTPTIDVAWIDGGVSELASDAGVLEPLAPETIPNLANIIPQGLYTNANDEIYAVSTGFYAVGLVYNTKEIREEPTDWEDLWNTQYSGQVTLPSPDNAMGIPFLFAINALEGGTTDNLEPGFNKLNDLDVYSYFPSSGSATNSFQAGEVTIGAHYASAAWAMADKGLPIKYMVPKSRALGGDIRLHISKGTKNLEAAQQFVNFALAPEQAACMSEKIYVGPATKDVVLSDSAKIRMPWGADGSIDNLQMTNWTDVNNKRSAVNSQWNKTLAH